MWRQCWIHCSVLTCVLSLSLTDTFLFQNAPAALTNLATSASAYASSPSAPATHIANLRRNRQKAEKLQAGKLLAEDDDPFENLSIEGAASDDANEAAPSLLQKKIGKILTKLRFISSLTGASSGSGSDVTEENVSVNINTTTTVPNESLNKTSSELDNDIPTKASEEITTERIKTFQKIIYPHSNYETPLKVSFDINERIVNGPDGTGNAQESEKLQAEEDMGKFGQIGVFFAEILGSIVGLLYGAAAQITSGSVDERSVG